MIDNNQFVHQMSEMAYVQQVNHHLPMYEKKTYAYDDPCKMVLYI